MIEVSEKVENKSLTSSSATTGPALPNSEFLTFDPLATTPETTPEMTRGPSPEAPGPSPVAPRTQGLCPWALGPRREGSRAGGEGPRVVLGIVSRVTARGSKVRNSLFRSAGSVEEAPGGTTAPVVASTLFYHAWRRWYPAPPMLVRYYSPQSVQWAY